MLSAPGNPDPSDPRYAWTRPWDLARPKTPLHHQGRPVDPAQHDTQVASWLTSRLNPRLKMNWLWLQGMLQHAQRLGTEPASRCTCRTSPACDQRRLCGMLIMAAGLGAQALGRLHRLADQRLQHAAHGSSQDR